MVGVELWRPTTVTIMDSQTSHDGVPTGGGAPANNVFSINYNNFIFYINLLLKKHKKETYR